MGKDAGATMTELQQEYIIKDMELEALMLAKRDIRLEVFRNVRSRPYTTTSAEKVLDDSIKMFEIVKRKLELETMDGKVAFWYVRDIIDWGIGKLQQQAERERG